MIAVVAGAPVASGELVRRGPMNFGQDIPEWHPAPYCLHLPTDRLVAELQPVYDTFLCEALADARQFPGDWTELAPLMEAGFPLFSDLPAVLPRFLADVLRQSLDTDLLDAFLPHHEGTPIRYLANTVDHVAVDDAWIAVCGRAFQVPVSRPV